MAGSRTGRRRLGRRRGCSCPVRVHPEESEQRQACLFLHGVLHSDPAGERTVSSEEAEDPGRGDYQATGDAIELHQGEQELLVSDQQVREPDKQDHPVEEVPAEHPGVPGQ